ncbi:MAG: YifB family Mg chelatase-like AAA ATPase [Oceanospirillaceae bacterium]|nr:YifB family Mg chelatase-like AAA ATPase [Oceanospirillaceae bacterium]
MSLAVVHARAVFGVAAPAVTVEVHLSGGLPSLSIVGLPEAAVRESKDRVRSALINAGFDYPQRRITVNLAPADLPKEGGRYDLAIALGVLAASQQVPGNGLNDWEVLGELTLSGQLRPVSGVLPAAVACRDIRRRLLIPRDNGDEAALVRDVDIRVASHLLEVCAALRGESELEPACVTAAEVPSGLPDLADVKGQFQARRALEVAAAGGHNLLFSGTPGSGKSMLAARLPSLLPPLDERERLEVAAVYSVAGRPVAGLARGERPFRNPHHTASAAALVGGGSQPRPGEISLAHRGVLFLDELPEFPRAVLEVLREPLETGEILISRAARQTQFPARFQLLAAMNPCPCGYFGDASGRCRCTPDQIQRYQARISGPLLDRFDMLLHVAPLPPDQLLQTGGGGESSERVAQRVAAALGIQQRRQGCPNRELSGSALDDACDLEQAERALLVQAASRLGLSARACHRVLRVARTLADLAGSARVEQAQLLEAIGFRQGLADRGNR